MSGESALAPRLPLGFAAGDANLFRYVGNSPTNWTDPSGLEYLAVEGSSVYWVVEEDGWWYDADVQRIYIGELDGETILLDDAVGGGVVRRDLLEALLARWWRNRPDLSGLSQKVRNSYIREALTGLKHGPDRSSGPSAAAQYAAAAATGLKTGLKAEVNAVTGSAAGMASLGFVDNFDVWTVYDEDWEASYGAANAFCRVGTELAVGVGTGRLVTLPGKIGQAGTVIACVDAAGNAVGTVRGGCSIAKDGLNLQNGIQVAGGLAGLTGNAAGALRRGKSGPKGMRNLTGEFSATERQMVQRAEEALRGAGYDTSLMKEVIRADLPKGTRGMTMGSDAAVVGNDAFRSQAMLNHVLEEELRHLQQKAAGLGQQFGPRTAQQLEEAAGAARMFPEPR